MSLKPSEQVVIPWGLGEVRGTVLSLFGRFARVGLELEGDDGTIRVVSLPVDLLQRK